MILENIVWSVEGMHCVHCETAIERALSGLPGLEEPRADYRRGTLKARWDASVLPLEKIQQQLEIEGYTLKPCPKPRHEALRLLLLLPVLALLYWLVTSTPLAALANAFPLAKAGMSLGALFLVGLMTSVHCVAMCGGINLSQSANAAQKGQKVLRSNLLYQGGRVLSYTLVGAVVGALGSLFSLTDGMKAALQILAAALMLIMALNLMGSFSWLRRLSFHLPKGLSGKLSGLTRGRSSFFIGLANGLMPCGPLQSMQIFALSTGSPVMGGLSMLCFALGTVPLMLGFGVLGGTLNRRFQRPMRLISAALVIIMGMNMLSSGLSLMGVSVQLTPDVPDNIAVVAANGQTVHSQIDYGSYPTITVQAGLPVTWTISVDEDKLNGCNNALVIPSLGLYVKLEPGDNVITFTPEEEGIIAYSCWMGMIRASIQVVSSLSS